MKFNGGTQHEQYASLLDDRPCVLLGDENIDVEGMLHILADKEKRSALPKRC